MIVVVSVFLNCFKLYNMLMFVEYYSVVVVFSLCIFIFLCMMMFVFRKLILEIICVVIFLGLFGDVVMEFRIKMVVFVVISVLVCNFVIC